MSDTTQLLKRIGFECERTAKASEKTAKHVKALAQLATFIAAILLISIIALVLRMKEVF